MKNAITKIMCLEKKNKRIIGGLLIGIIAIVTINIL